MNPELAGLHPGLKSGAAEHPTWDGALFEGSEPFLALKPPARLSEGRGPMFKDGRILYFNRHGLIFQIRKLRPKRHKGPNKDDLVSYSTAAAWTLPCSPAPCLLLPVYLETTPDSWHVTYPAATICSFLHLSFPPSSSSFCIKKLLGLKLPHETLSGNLISSTNKLLHYTWVLKITSLSALGFLPVSRGRCVKITRSMVTKGPP